MRYCITLVLMAFLTGCLSVVRIPLPEHEKFSDDGICTNRVWVIPLRDMQKENPDIWRVYPTIWMRWHVTTSVYGKPIDEKLKGEDLYNAKMTKRWAWFPLTILWLTSPLDGIIDTIALPFDLNVELIH